MTADGGRGPMIPIALPRAAEDGGAAPARALEPSKDGANVVSLEAHQVESWLRRLVDGDPDAAAWMYDTFGPRLHRRLRGRYGYPGGLDPDDLLHDAFVYFFQARCAAIVRIVDRVPPGQLTAAILERALWDLACGVAANRRRAARRRRRDAPLDPNVLDEPPEEERLAVSRDLLQRLDACLRRARPQVYLYFKLRYGDGLTPSEISAAVGWPQRVTYKLKESLAAALSDCAARLGIHT